MCGKFQTVGPQVYIRTSPSFIGLNSSSFLPIVLKNVMTMKDSSRISFQLYQTLILIRKMGSNFDSSAGATLKQRSQVIPRLFLFGSSSETAKNKTLRICCSEDCKNSSNSS